MNASLAHNTTPVALSHQNVTKNGKGGINSKYQPM
jgi:hypothetical protein